MQRRYRVYFAVVVFAGAIAGFALLLNHHTLPQVTTLDTTSTSQKAVSSMDSYEMNYPDPPGPPRDIPYLDDITSSSNNFAFGLLQENLKASPTANVAVSPVSLSQAFYLAGNGAAGDTEAKLRKLFGLEADWDSINEANGLWLEDAAKLRGIDLNIATAIWTASGLTVAPEFARTAESYEAELRTLHSNPGQAVAEINDLVSSNTRGLITQIVTFLPQETNLFLANAVYFMGKWSIPFDKQNTQPAQFYLQGDSSIECQMMWCKAEFMYMETDDFQMVRLPYGSWGEACMIVMLPREQLTATELALQLNAETYKDYSERLKRLGNDGEGTVEIPRFELDSQPSLDVLYKQLGIAANELADFSRISPDLANNRIIEVAHKVVVKVNEEGTEAAAVTAIGIGYMGMPEPKKPFHFRADRPFLFFIEDRHGVLLFTGIVNDPSTAAAGNGGDSMHPAAR